MLFLENVQTNFSWSLFVIMATGSDVEWNRAIFNHTDIHHIHLLNWQQMNRIWGY